MFVNFFIFKNCTPLSLSYRLSWNSWGRQSLKSVYVWYQLSGQFLFCAGLSFSLTKFIYSLHVQFSLSPVTNKHHFVDGPLLYQFRMNFRRRRRLIELLHERGRSIPESHDSPFCLRKQNSDGGNTSFLSGRNCTTHTNANEIRNCAAVPHLKPDRKCLMWVFFLFFLCKT